MKTNRITIDMHIVYITPVFPPYRAGMSRVALLYAQWAHEAGHEVVVYTPGDRNETDDSFGFLTQRVRSLLRYGNASVLFSFPLRKQPDVIHLHFPFIGGMYALWKLKRRYKDARLVVTYHMDLVGIGYIRRFLFWLWSFFALRYVAKHADVIHVTSFDYFSHSQLARFVSVADPRVKEIALSIDDIFFDSTRRSHVDSSGVLIVAALDEAHRFKGIPQALEALSVLKDKGVGVQLCVIGRGSCKEEYERYAVARGVDAHVRFIGGVEEYDLIRYLAGARVCAVPSTSASEAFGLVLVEAQACGTPVVASDLPGVRTVFQHGLTGLRVAPGDVSALADAMHMFVSCSQDVYRQWSDQARSYVRERYHPDVIRDIILTLYT